MLLLTEMQIAICACVCPYELGTGPFPFKHLNIAAVSKELTFIFPMDNELFLNCCIQHVSYDGVIVARCIITVDTFL